MNWQILKISFLKCSQYIMIPVIIIFTCFCGFSQISFTDWVKLLHFREWDCLLFQHSAEKFFNSLSNRRMPERVSMIYGISVGRSEVLSCVWLLSFGLSIDWLWVANMAWHVYRGSWLSERGNLWITTVKGNKENNALRLVCRVHAFPVVFMFLYSQRPSATLYSSSFLCFYCCVVE